MAWQYRIIDLDNIDSASAPIQSLESAESVLARDRRSYPWPDRLVIQKQWVGSWEPLEPPTQYWEDYVTVGRRKAWDDADTPPETDAGWEPDYSRGRPGQAWDRFDYTEESYWRRWIGEGDRPADEQTPYVTATGERLTIEEARVTRKPEYFPIVWAPQNEKLR